MTVETFSFFITNAPPTNPLPSDLIPLVRLDQTYSITYAQLKSVLTQPLIPAAYTGGTATAGGTPLAAGQRILRHTAVIPFTMTAGSTIVLATADYAATGLATGTIKWAPASAVNSLTQVGSFAFAVGSASGPGSISITQVWGIGDVLVIDGPAVADATLAGVSVAILAARPA